jgi:beta-galactosidase/beta-glucuronidase
LNGEWQFEIDRSDSGFARGLLNRSLEQSIIVPFCPESELSGIGNTDFLNAVWYKREVRIPTAWKGKEVILHIGACDYDTTVWVNGNEVTRHRGGFTPIEVNLENLARAGETITICIRARDYRDPPQPRGKQSQRYENHGCLYTRTTGIWQTVWLEPVPKTHLKRPRITPHVGAALFRISQPISGGEIADLQVRATIKDSQGVVWQHTVMADVDFCPELDLFVPSDRRHLWSPNDPYLYDLTIELLDARGKVLDRAESYAGLRGIAIHGKSVKLNGQNLFQRLVLDQGYYADGIMTAPTDEALIRDIELAMEAGFNGARLHQKVFEERFLYHADRMGYLCWGEFPDWGLRRTGLENNIIQADLTCAAQWMEVIQRDYNHPSIIGWCGLNETYQEIQDGITMLDDATHAMFMAAKAFDTTRPVLDASGYSHRVAQTDVFDCHDYEQDPKKFARNHAGLSKDKPFYNGPKKSPWSFKYRGQPFWVSEFGGIHWKPGTRLLTAKNYTEQEALTTSWGYGESPRTVEEFLHRFEGLCGVLLDHPDMFGYCYTQLTDVFQEENGLYNFDRSPKFDEASMERIRKAQVRAAAIEMKGKK